VPVHSLGRAAANEHWRYALCVIALRLNGQKMPKTRQRRVLIAIATEARHFLGGTDVKQTEAHEEAS